MTANATAPQSKAQQSKSQQSKSQQANNSPKSSLGLIWDFLKVRKKWWLTPIVLFSLLLGLLIVLTQGSAVAPFIYTLF